MLIPPLIASLPADYFHPRAKPRHKRPWTVLAVCVWVLRNGFGWFLILAGVLMLVLPGQGLLTILAGLALVDFPGKRSAERWVLQAPGVRRLVQWSRERAGKPPLEF